MVNNGSYSCIEISGGTLWKYADEDCEEMTDCPLWPCNVTGCHHTIIPTPGYCQEFQCWTDDKPIGK